MTRSYLAATLLLSMSAIAHADLDSGGVYGGAVPQAGTNSPFNCRFAGSSALGAVLGGLVGSQAGGGNGRYLGAGIGAAVGALAGADCDKRDSSQPYIPVIGRRLSINGFQLSETSPSDFPAGKFAGLSRIKSKADIAGLDALTKGLAKAQWQAAAKGDWESFAIARRVGMRLAEYRLHQKIATVDFVESLARSGTGTGTLAPGATVFIPAFARFGRDSVYASNADYVRQILATSVNEIDLTRGAKTADLNGFLNGLSAALGGTKPAQARAGGNAQMASNANSDALAQLPVGAVFSAHDAAGNSFLVERTVDGFNVGNNGPRPVSVPLTKLGFIPDMPTPSASRQEAGELVKHMQAVRQQLFWQSVQQHVGATSDLRAPNVAFVGSTVVQLDDNGDRATTADAAFRGATAFKTSATYRAALDQAKYVAHIDQQFKTACFAQPGVAGYDTTYLGQYSEILRHQCFDQGGNPIRNRDYFVIDGKKMQTAESLLQDKSIADKLKNADSAGNLAESLLGFVPLAGNLDAASKCLTGTSLSSVGVSAFTSYRTGAQGQYRAFVSDLLPSPEDAGTIEKGLTCAAAIPAVGTVAKGLSKTGAVAGLFRDWSATEQAAGVFKSLDFFESNILAGKADFSSLAGISGKGIDLLKTVYDGTQNLSGAKQVASSIMEMI